MQHKLTPIEPGSSPLRVIVTRPREQALPWVAELSRLGVPASALPLIEIGPAVDVQPLATAWCDITTFSLVMFVSANAVQRFFAARPNGVVWPEHTRGASTGPGTSAALRAAGLSDAQVVEPVSASVSAPVQFDSEALWQQLANESWQGSGVLVVRGDEGRDWLAQRWRERGASVRFVSAYRRLLPQWTGEEHRLCDAAIEPASQAVWLFSSSEAVRNLRTLRPGASFANSAALATHERIAQAALGIGFARVMDISPQPSAVAPALQRIAQERSVQSLAP